MKIRAEKTVRHLHTCAAPYHVSLFCPIYLQPIKHFAQILFGKERKADGGIREKAWEGAEL